MSEKNERGFVALIWGVLSSQRTTALLVMLLSVSAAIAAVVPQGKDAIELAKDQAATGVHEMAAWGLTDIFSSYWILGAFVLLGGNLVAVFLGYWMRESGAGLPIEPPAKAPLSVDLKARYPEIAVEVARETFLERIGAPSAQKTDGSRVVMAFDTGAGSSMAPLLTHLGLLMMVVGAGLFAAGESERPRLVHAQLEVTDTRGGAVGLFDMAENEPFKFFQWPSTYFVRSYEPSFKGQGPMLILEQVREGVQGPGLKFPVFSEAPAGFDERHRNAEVQIKPVRMGYMPVPGVGLADSPYGALMLIGLAFIGFGAFFGQRARGRVWVDVEGKRVRLVAIPQSEGDPDFSARFHRWALSARAMLDPEY